MSLLTSTAAWGQDVTKTQLLRAAQDQHLQNFKLAVFGIKNPSSSDSQSKAQSRSSPHLRQILDLGHGSDLIFVVVTKYMSALRVGTNTESLIAASLAVFNAIRQMSGELFESTSTLGDGRNRTGDTGQCPGKFTFKSPCPKNNARSLCTTSGKVGGRQTYLLGLIRIEMMRESRLLWDLRRTFMMVLLIPCVKFTNNSVTLMRKRLLLVECILPPAQGGEVLKKLWMKRETCAVPTVVRRSIRPWNMCFGTVIDMLI